MNPSGGWERDLKWEEEAHERMRRLGWTPDQGPLPQAFIHPTRYLWAMIGFEDISSQNAPPDKRWHISLRGPDRVPTWDELAASCHELRPGVNFVVAIPTESMWMNVHEHVLHAWETKDANLEASFRATAQMARKLKAERTVGQQATKRTPGVIT